MHETPTVYTNNVASASEILCLTGAIFLSLLGAAKRGLSVLLFVGIVSAAVEPGRWCLLRFFRT